MIKNNLAAWIEATLTAVIAALLIFVPTMTSLGFGANITLIPIFVVAYRRGWKYGVLSGFISGVLQLVLGRASIISFWQVLLEYFFATAFAGLAGIFASEVREAFAGEKVLWRSIWTVGLSSFVGTFAEYFIHFLSGYIFWSSFTPEGMNPWLYTFIFNGATALVSWLVAWLVIWLMFWTNSQLLFVKKV